MSSRKYRVKQRIARYGSPSFHLGRLRRNNLVTFQAQSRICSNARCGRHVIVPRTHFCSRSS